MGKKRKKNIWLPLLIFLGVWTAGMAGFDVGSLLGVLLTAGVAAFAFFRARSRKAAGKSSCCGGCCDACGLCRKKPPRAE